MADFISESPADIKSETVADFRRNPQPGITLVPLPPYAPELNPIERVWLFLRERFLSHRLLEGYDAIVSACCEAWNALTPERLRSLCAFPWIAKVSS